MDPKVRSDTLYQMEVSDSSLAREPQGKGAEIHMGKRLKFTRVGRRRNKEIWAGQ